jgi:hypothetical protein
MGQVRITPSEGQLLEDVSRTPYAPMYPGLATTLTADQTELIRDIRTAYVHGLQLISNQI